MHRLTLALIFLVVCIASFVAVTIAHAGWDFLGLPTQGTYSTINSNNGARFREGGRTTAKDFLRCYVMALAPNAQWTCDNRQCSCAPGSGPCPPSGYRPLYVAGFPVNTIRKVNGDPDFYVLGTANSGLRLDFVGFSELDQQEAFCFISSDGRTARMEVGSWH